MVFFQQNVNLEAVAYIDANLCSFVFVLFILLAFCDEEKKLLLHNFLIMSFFLHNCTYLTFDLTVTLNRKITLGIHPYIVCNSPRNNSSLDAEH